MDWFSIALYNAGKKDTPVKMNKTIKTLRRSIGAPSKAASVDEVEIRFGMRLKALRLKAKLTQQDIAEQWGIDRGHYSCLEAGSKTASLQMLEVLSLGFGISLSDLLKGV